MSNEEDSRYIRWQGYRIQQLGYAVNLFLGFAVASLGFAIAKGASAYPRPLAWWTVSAAAGVIAVLSRLVDFRYTCKKIDCDSRLNRCVTKATGFITWVSFGVQVGAYCIGAVGFVMAAQH